MEFGFCGNCWLVLSIIAFVFYFYLFLICAFDPDRFHIKTHVDPAQDKRNHTTAWTSALAACFIYFLIGGILFLLKYNDRKKWNERKEWFGPSKQVELKPSTYELSEFNK